MAQAESGCKIKKPESRKIQNNNEMAARFSAF
jgi:hypothetical protein